ncbi:MAG TPA: hypothetical protein VLA12_02560, partial [Planctomycetaceae bacterium]|nr:hypothetical protein [Planctomycetaceae bacterium]
AREFVYRYHGVDLLTVYFWGLENIVAEFSQPPDQSYRRSRVSWTLSLNGESIFPDGRQGTKYARLDPGDLVEMRREMRTPSESGVGELIKRTTLPLSVDYIGTGGLGSGSSWHIASYPVVTPSGNNRYFGADESGFVSQVGHALDRIGRSGLVADVGDVKSDLTLSIDRALQSNLSKLCSQQCRELGDTANAIVAITAMDIQSGQILAIAESAGSANTGRNWNFKNHAIGSAFKPFLSLAALYVYPQLADLKLQLGRSGFAQGKMFVSPEGENRQDSVAIFGLRMPAFGDREWAKWNVVDFNAFMRRSVNYYAVALTLLATCDVRSADKDDPFARRLESNRLDFVSRPIDGINILESLAPYVMIVEDVNGNRSGEVVKLRDSRFFSSIGRLFDVDITFDKYGMRDVNPWLGLLSNSAPLSDQQRDEIRSIL